jgi:alpha-ketoglutarate-dependent 2,4-dichlorophenoxyacetate dioxygenase
MSIKVTPVHPNIGAEVQGLDLRVAPAGAAFQSVEEALNRYQVLVFRNQDLSKDEFLQFARIFGQPESFRLRGYGNVPANGKKVDDVPAVQRLTNLNDAGVPMGPCPQMDRMSIAENWHSDSSYRAVPSYVTLLHGVETPTEGGDTHFTSQYAAYEALPPSLQKSIEPFEVIHNWEYQRTLSPGMEPITEDERKSTPPVMHRLVQRHPATGRKHLFISASAEFIDGLPRAEGRALLDELTRICTRPEAIYTHKWQVRDVVMWDNRATLHRAGGFDYRSPTLRRLLHRVVIAGNPAAYRDQNAADNASRVASAR